MNILLINHYAGSLHHGMEYRPYYLAREWVRLGHRVLILASAQSHVRTRQPDLRGLDCSEEVIDGIQYVWFKGPKYASNGLGRVWNMAAFVWRLFVDGPKAVQVFRPDIVIASSTYPMDIWPAHRIAMLSKCKLIYEVHDLWPLSPMELGGMSRWHPFIILVQTAEDYAYRHSDVVISMLPEVRRYMEARGMAPSKLHIVPNGIDPDEWSVDGSPLTAPALAEFARLRADGYAIVGYAGSHGVANALDTLLDAAKLMQDEKIAFVLVGKGPEKAALQQRVRQEDIGNVLFIDSVSKEQVPSLLQWFDIAYIGLRSQPLFRFGIAPNKLMDYMMGGCAVLMAVESGNDPVAEAGCGLTVGPEDSQAVVDGIHRMLALSPDARKVMGQRGRDFVLQRHTYPVLARRFLEATT